MITELEFIQIYHSPADQWQRQCTVHLVSLRA